MSIAFSVRPAGLMAFFSLLFLDESWFQDELRACLIQSQTQKEGRRDSAEDITKEYATIRKDLSETERKKKEKMKRLFSMLLLCFVNGPVFFYWMQKCLGACLSLSLFLSLFLSLSISKAFLPISRSSFFPIVYLPVSLLNSSVSQSRADSMLRERNSALSVRLSLNISPFISHLFFWLSFLSSSLSNQMAHLPFGFFLEGCLTAGNFHIPSPLLSSPHLTCPLLSSGSSVC